MTKVAAASTLFRPGLLSSRVVGLNFNRILYRGFVKIPVDPLLQGDIGATCGVRVLSVAQMHRRRRKRKIIRVLRRPCYTTSPRAEEHVNKLKDRQMCASNAAVIRYIFRLSHYRFCFISANRFVL